MTGYKAKRNDTGEPRAKRKKLTYSKKQGCSRKVNVTFSLLLDCITPTIGIPIFTIFKSLILHIH